MRRAGFYACWLGVAAAVAVSGCGGGSSSTPGTTPTTETPTTGKGHEAIHEPIQSRGIKGEDPSAEAETTIALSSGDCAALGKLAEKRLGVHLTLKSTPKPPLSKCTLSGGGAEINVYLDSGFAAHQRYSNRIDETVQFNGENPAGLPQPVPHLGEKAAYNADANWIPAVRSLLAVRGNRWLTVTISVKGLSDRQLRDEAATLALAGFKLTAAS